MLTTVHGRTSMVKDEGRRQLYYTDGNTVRKIAAPVEKPRSPERIRRPEEKKGHRRSYRKADNLEMSLPYVIFLFAMVVVIVVSCVRYLDLNAKISDTNSRIANLQSQLDTLVTKNDAIEYDINGFIDVEYIINTAKEQLGMVVAGKEQVIFFDSTTSEYMNQYSDVPAY